MKNILAFLAIGMVNLGCATLMDEVPILKERRAVTRLITASEEVQNSGCLLYGLDPDNMLKFILKQPKLDLENEYLHVSNCKSDILDALKKDKSLGAVIAFKSDYLNAKIIFSEDVFSGINDTKLTLFCVNNTEQICTNKENGKITDKALIQSKLDDWWEKNSHQYSKSPNNLIENTEKIASILKEKIEVAKSEKENEERQISIKKTANELKNIEKKFEKKFCQSLSVSGINADRISPQHPRNCLLILTGFKIFQKTESGALLKPINPHLIPEPYLIFLEGASFLSDLVDNSAVGPLIVLYKGPFSYRSVLSVRTIKSFRALGEVKGLKYSDFGELYFE